MVTRDVVFLWSCFVCDLALYFGKITDLSAENNMYVFALGLRIWFHCIAH